MSIVTTEEGRALLRRIGHTPANIDAVADIERAVRQQEESRLEERVAAFLDSRLEELAALEHDQWIAWSRTVAQQGLTPERLERWERFWVPYADLDEATKEHDRVWARRVLLVLHA